MVIQHDDGTVEFAFFRPAARTVRLAGNFAVPAQNMQRDKSGWWRLRLAIEPGEYRFRYRVDEMLLEADFAAYGVEPDKNGGWFSVLWITGQPTAQRAAA